MQIFETLKSLKFLNEVDYSQIFKLKKLKFGPNRLPIAGSQTAGSPDCSQSLDHTIPVSHDRLSCSSDCLFTGLPVHLIARSPNHQVARLGHPITGCLINDSPDHQAIRLLGHSNKVLKSPGRPLNCLPNLGEGDFLINVFPNW